MGLTYNKPTRDLALLCTIIPRDPTKDTLVLDTRKDQKIVKYSWNTQISSEGLPLGAVGAASFTLEVDNTDRTYAPGMLDNAEVKVQIGILTDGEYVFSDFGTWFVDSCNAPEQSVCATLFGYDALGSRFDAEFEDTSKGYPITIDGLLTNVCAAAGVTLANHDFPNAAVQIKKKPKWQDGVTLRDIVSYCAICAGGFAYITLDGKLKIANYADGQLYAVDSSLYRTFTLDGGETFRFNCIEAKMKDDAEKYTRFAVNANLAGDATNTIQIDYNPMLTNAILNSVVTELTGLEATSGTFDWGGDPAVRCGDFFDVTTLDGSVVHTMVTSLSYQFDGGLSSTVTCAMPPVNTSNGASYGASGSVYDSNGNIKATRVSGLDGKVVSATAAHFETLTAGELTAAEIRADRLVASLINALKIRAENIEAGSATIDDLTAMVAKIVQATIDKINSNVITTDELYAALATVAVAQITTANIQNANIEWAKINSLAVGIAEIVQAKVEDIEITAAQIADLQAKVAELVQASIGDAEIGFAQIKDLVANTAVFTQGTAGELYIAKLAVTEANMVSLTVGELIVRGQDGKFYSVSVDESGTIVTTQKQIDNEDIEDASINAGEKVIAGSITAATLNTKDIFADNAIIRQLIAANLDVATLFAREATISELNTADISNNQYLKLAVSQIEVGGTNLLSRAAGDKIVEISENSQSGYGFNVAPTTNVVTRKFSGLSLRPGVEYTVSFAAWIESESDSDAQALTVDLYPDDLPQTSYKWTSDDAITRTPKRYIWTLKSDSENMRDCSLRFIFDSVASTGERVKYPVYITDVKLERGNKATDWSPTPDELYIGSEIEISRERIKLLSAETSIAIPSADSVDGEEVVSIDENGLNAKIASVEEFSSPTVVPARPKASYTPANAGEMQAILDNLSGGYLKGDVTIDASAVTGGRITINGLHGNGHLHITGGTFNGVAVTNCAARVALYDSTIETDTAAVSITASDLDLVRCVISAYLGIDALYMSEVVMQDCTGSCKVFANVAQHSDLRVVGTSQPYGLLGDLTGGEVYSPLVFEEEPVPSEQPTIITATLPAISTKTWGSGWLDGSYLYQGRTGSNALRRGCMWFDLTEIKGKTIISATLTFTRVNGIGGGGTVDAMIYGTTAKEASGTPVIGTKFAEVAIANGATKTVDITQGAAALAAGTISGLMLYNEKTDVYSGKNYTRSYSKFYGAGESDRPILTVTYK